MSRKGLMRAIAVLLIVGAVVAAIMLWPSKGSTTDKGSAHPTPTRTAAKSAMQVYFDKLSKAIKNGDLQQQAPYVADDFRKDFVTRGVPMLPKGSTVVFLTNTLVTDSPNTGGFKAIVTKNGIKSTRTVLVLKEQDKTGAYVWHISDVEEANS